MHIKDVKLDAELFILVMTNVPDFTVDPITVIKLEFVGGEYLANDILSSDIFLTEIDAYEEGIVRLRIKVKENFDASAIISGKIDKKLKKLKDKEKEKKDK